MKRKFPECRQNGTTIRKADEIVRGWRLLDRLSAKRPGAWASLVQAMSLAYRQKEVASEDRK